MTERYLLLSRRDIGDVEWNRFVDSSPDAWLWHRSELGDALGSWPGSQDLSFALADMADSGRIIAVCPLRRIEKRIAGLPGPFILESLGGIAFADPPTDRKRRDMLDALGKHIERHAHSPWCLEMRMSLAPMAPARRGARCPNINPLVEMGFTNTPGQTWVVNLEAGSDSLWQRFEGRARTAIRKAKKSGMEIREARPEDLTRYYELHQETYARTGARAHPKAYFEAIWRYFIPQGLARVWVAEHDGQLIAAQNFGLYKRAGIYWTGAASQRGLELEAHSLLQWTGMRWMIDQGFVWHETGEAFPGARAGKLKGLNDFKRGFGGDLYPFYKGAMKLRGWPARLYRCLQDSRT